MEDEQCTLRSYVELLMLMNDIIRIHTRQSRDGVNHDLL